MPTAIEFFKYLPKTNCGECGQPTCLAFAMQLANQKASLDLCPYVDQDAKSRLEESSAPPIRGVTVGSGEKAVRMGEETVLYRHERRFVNPIAYAVTFSDLMSADEMNSEIQRYQNMVFERVGMLFHLDIFALSDDSHDPERFKEAAERLASTGMPLVLMSSDAELLRPVAELLRERRPLIYAANSINYERMFALARDTSLPLALLADDLEEMADLTEKARSFGLEDLVLDLGSSNMKNILERNTIARKVSLRRMFKGLGYPLMNRVGSGEAAVMKAMLATMKYGSLVIFDSLEAQQALPLMTLRQNIYTDPQVPIQVKEDLYHINGPTEDSPILFTTNFSLTYFTVRADLEKSRYPVWLQVVDTEGLSVLTAYAAGKFSHERVAAALEKSGALQKSSGPVVTPGMVAKMSGKLEDLVGRKVIVGPVESSGLPKFLKNLKE
ncbi:MAG: acetyl-CoA decarbonylase/synthase, complex subunit gamma [Candidatus Methanomethylophilaceae archaeon]|nr:acetyl-CoA decarbonylase/synthase, complex subunit gamma [Candidatus Methanomethylophilaceae archaeon]